jgi:hypothetical protein
LLTSNGDHSVLDNNSLNTRAGSRDIPSTLQATPAIFHFGDPGQSMN